MLKKIRSLLLKRCENSIHYQKQSSTKDFDDIGDKMDQLCRKMDYFQNEVRNEDDQLLMTLFEAQHNWHELTKKLHEDIVKLNQRLIELERFIQLKSPQNH